MAKDLPIQFKGTTLKIIQAQVRTTDPAALHAALADLTGNSPDFFENDLAVLDFSKADALAAEADWPAIRRLLRASGLHAVATLGLPDDMAASAEAAGLPAIPIDAISRPARTKASEAPPAEAAAAQGATTKAAASDHVSDISAGSTPKADASSPAHGRPGGGTRPGQASPSASVAAAPVEGAGAPHTVVLDKPLRSGQRFYARGSDLIVTAMVSAGAEVIADGHIHVYAPLRGRALAGASGDRAARIFTTSLEAELVSVAGIYRTFEAGVPAELARQPATVSLSGDAEPSLLVARLALR